MKKARILLPLLAAVMAGVFSTGCVDDTYIDSTQQRVMEATVYRNQWNDDGSGYLWHSFDWDYLTADVLQYGTINAYVYVGERQMPLPNLVPVTYTHPDGTTEVVPENMTYDLEPGRITFIMQDQDGGMPVDINEDYTFRVVARWPVRYIIE